MGTGVDLLKLLEPVVRPGGLPGPKGAGAGSGPIETRSFESLLSEASGTDSSDTDTAGGGGESVLGVGGASRKRRRRTPCKP